MVDDNHIGCSPRHCHLVNGVELEDSLKLVSLRKQNIDGCLRDYQESFLFEVAVTQALDVIGEYNAIIACHTVRVNLMVGEECRQCLPCSNMVWSTEGTSSKRR